MNEPPETDVTTVDPGGFLDDRSKPEPCLADLPVGARLLIRTRADWRVATVAAATPERVTITVCSPTGRTYRLRRPPDLPLYNDGSIPIAGKRGSWRVSLARYDLRW